MFSCILCFCRLILIICLTSMIPALISVTVFVQRSFSSSVCSLWWWFSHCISSNPSSFPSAPDSSSTRSPGRRPAPRPSASGPWAAGSRFPTFTCRCFSQKTAKTDIYDRCAAEKTALNKLEEAGSDLNLSIKQSIEEIHVFLLLTKNKWKISLPLMWILDILGRIEDKKSEAPRDRGRPEGVISRSQD